MVSVRRAAWGLAGYSVTVRMNSLPNCDANIPRYHVRFGVYVICENCVYVYMCLINHLV